MMIELTLDDLLVVASDEGRLTFAGQRALLLDAAALGLLRQQLIELLGHHGARGVLTRFGFAHGWRTAETLRHAVPWTDEGDWKRAGGQLHQLQGLVRFEPDPRSEGLASALWHHSYEAEQHLLHLGPEPHPVCWTLTGFASGYLSHVHNTPVYAVEQTCVACGDPVCRMIARTQADWGSEIDPILPFYERDCLDDHLAGVRDALLQAERTLHARAEQPPEQAAERSGLIARSDTMRQLVELAQRVARVDTPVLITGESGSGKERFARFIHQQSRRAAGPFVAINCGALPENLLESELFGHARGAFTGAEHDRVGLFEAASSGTLFLDEVGEISPAMQVKLLRVLQERRIRRVGETHDRPIDARILSATHRDLDAAARSGHIREDFLFRLRVIELPIPPLRARRDDILPLAQRFLTQITARLDCPPRHLSPQAAQRLLAYDWPGNVRELHNALEHAVVLARTETLTPSDLPAALSAGRDHPQPPIGRSTPSIRSLAEVEREHILATLEAVGGNRALAAQHLGLGVATLYRRLRRYREEV